MKKTTKIAIDGPSGAGKSTLAKKLSEKLGFVYVDTGAIYRTVGLYAKRNGIDPHDDSEIKKYFHDINVTLSWGEDGKQHVYLNDEDVSLLIRTPEASMYASAVSALPSVRAFLFEMQRSIANENNVIMDGRDIGTVILPDADVKIFMSATPEARAERRYLELKEKGKSDTYEEVLSAMIERDKNDSSRDIAPCVPAEDAIMFDNTGYTPEQTVMEALKIIEVKLK